MGWYPFQVKSIWPSGLKGWKSKNVSLCKSGKVMKVIDVIMFILLLRVVE